MTAARQASDRAHWRSVCWRIRSETGGKSTFRSEIGQYLRRFAPTSAESCAHPRSLPFHASSPANRVQSTVSFVLFQCFLGSLSGVGPGPSCPAPAAAPPRALASRGGSAALAVDRCLLAELPVSLPE